MVAVVNQNPRTAPEASPVNDAAPFVAPPSLSQLFSLTNHPLIPVTGPSVDHDDPRAQRRQQQQLHNQIIGALTSEDPNRALGGAAGIQLAFKIADSIIEATKKSPEQIEKEQKEQREKELRYQAEQKAKLEEERAKEIARQLDNQEEIARVQRNELNRLRGLTNAQLGDHVRSRTT